MLTEAIVGLALFWSLPHYLLSVWPYTSYLTFLFIFKRVKLIPASWGCMRTKWNHIYLVATTAVYQIFLSPSRQKVGLFLSPLMIMQFTWLILLTSEHLNLSFQHRDFSVWNNGCSFISSPWYSEKSLCWSVKDRYREWYIILEVSH